MINQSTPPRSNVSPQPKIALILPAYNIARYLPDCLRSIANQIYKNFEVFAINDGSCDESGKILDDYARQDTRFRVIHTPNHGLSAARNVALNAIESDNTFDFIAFIDGDDKISEFMLEKLVSEALSSNSDIANCAFSKFDETGKSYLEGTLLPPHRLSREDFLSLLLADGRYKNLCGRGGMVWKCLYRTSCIRGIRFDEDRSVCEDELFNTNAALHASVITYIPEVLYFYRVRRHHTASSAQFDLKLAEGRYRAFHVAHKISEKAALLLVAAYIKTILSYAKKTLNQPAVSSKIPQSWISKVLATKLLDQKKKLLWFLLTQHPQLFSLYCRIRPNKRNG